MITSHAALTTKAQQANPIVSTCSFSLERKVWNMFLGKVWNQGLERRSGSHVACSGPYKLTRSHMCMCVGQHVSSLHSCWHPCDKCGPFDLRVRLFQYCLCTTAYLSDISATRQLDGPSQSIRQANGLSKNSNLARHLPDTHSKECSPTPSLRISPPVPWLPCRTQPENGRAEARIDQAYNLSSCSPLRPRCANPKCQTVPQERGWTLKVPPFHTSCLLKGGNMSCHRSNFRNIPPVPLLDGETRNPQVLFRGSMPFAFQGSVVRNDVQASLKAAKA